jgi:ribosome maturation factor RimP
LPLPALADLELQARPAVEAAGFCLVRLQLLSHRLPLTVQVMVRRGDGSDVSLDDCAAISGPLGEALEASGLLSGNWVLEVSSPGIGDLLQSDRDFHSFRGFPVRVRLQPRGGAARDQEGLLLGRDEQHVLINVRGRSLRLPREEVEQVCLISPAEDTV